MKKRPIQIHILVVLHLLAPFFSVIVSRLIKGEAITMSNLYTYESFMMNWPNYILPLVCAACIYLCKMWSFVVYLVCMVIMLVNSYFSFASEMESGSIALLAVAWVINLAVVFYFVRPNLRQIYTDPKLRWWEQSQRHECQITASFRQDDFNGEGEVLNFSKTGLFLKTDTQLKEDQVINITLTSQQDESLSFTGDVIFHKNQTEQGVGVKFIKGCENKKLAKKVIKELI